MKGVIVHAALLAVMLIYGYRTWTEDKTTQPTAGEVVMWNRPETDVKVIEFATADRTVRLERRGDGSDAYWWGIDTRTKKAKSPDEADHEEPAAAGEIAAKEFPVGDAGETLLRDVAHMRAIKAIGVVPDDAKKDYELVDNSKTLSVVLRDGAKTLVLGGRVYGGSDRYMLDLDTNKVFVIPGSIISPLESGESALRPTDIRGFDSKLAMQVQINAGDKTKNVERIKVKSDKKPDPHRGSEDDDGMVETWGTGQTADTEAANFIDKLEKLRPTGYAAQLDPKTLTSLVKLTYRDAVGKVLGSFELLKLEKPAEIASEAASAKPADPSNPTADPAKSGTDAAKPADPTAADAAKPAEPPKPVTEYYVRTERTRVPALVSGVAAERIVPDIATIFPP